MHTTTYPLPKGWVFSTAYFSVRAFGGNADGNETLVRNPAQRALWHKMPEHLKEADNGPPLFVTGTGMTLEQAFVDGEYKARRVLPIPGAEGGAP